MFLGIDVGTGGTRALVVDETGRVRAVTTAEHQPFRSPETGWAEQDPADWWQAAQLALSRLPGLGIRPQEIRAIGLTGQMHGAVLLDRNREVLRPALIWCDQRSEAEARELTRSIGANRLIEWTSNPALTNFTLTKLLWVRNHEPELWRRFDSFLLPKDYVRMKLTGECATDVADASGTLLLDVAARRWSSQMCEAAGIDARALPKVFESIEIVGRLSSEAAQKTGLMAGTPVVAGAGDQAAGAVGLGIVQPGMVSLTIGTSGVVFAATDRPALDPAGRLHTFCHAIPERWHVMGVTQAAGLSLRWFRDTFGAPGPPDRDAYENLAEEAAGAPPGADGVLWAPYLMGERTPHMDPRARAALVGLAASHGRAHIVRAILEGVAFSLKDTLTIFSAMKLPVERLRLGGGGARSPLWRQIQTDIFGQQTEIVEAEEGAAYGAAILAGVGVRAWASVDAACLALVRVAGRTAPDARNAERMRGQYERYGRVYSALRSIDPQEPEPGGTPGENIRLV